MRRARDHHLVGATRGGRRRRPRPARRRPPTRKTEKKSSSAFVAGPKYPAQSLERPLGHIPIPLEGRSNDLRGVYLYPSRVDQTTPQGVYLYPFVQVFGISEPKSLRILPFARHSGAISPKSARKVGTRRTRHWYGGSPVRVTAVFGTLAGGRTLHWRERDARSTGSVQTQSAVEPTT